MLLPLVQCIHHPAYWSCLHAISVTNAPTCLNITKPRSDCIIVILCNFSNMQVARTFSWMMPYVFHSASSSPAIHHFDFKEHWYWSWGRLMMGANGLGGSPSCLAWCPPILSTESLGKSMYYFLSSTLVPCPPAALSLPFCTLFYHPEI